MMNDALDFVRPLGLHSDFSRNMIKDRAKGSKSLNTRGENHLMTKLLMLSYKLPTHNRLNGTPHERKEHANVFYLLSCGWVRA